MKTTSRFFRYDNWQRSPAPEKVKDRWQTPDSCSSLVGAIVCGAVAGAVGTLAMSVSNAVEQGLTKRPNSFVPAHTAQRLLGLQEKPDASSQLANHAFQLAMGAAMGSARGALARAGVRGPYADLLHLVARVGLDQTLENTTGVGAPPWTWPKDEQWIDLAHKAVYALTTGTAIEAAVRSNKAVAINRS